MKKAEQEPFTVTLVVVAPSTWQRNVHTDPAGNTPIHLICDVRLVSEKLPPVVASANGAPPATAFAHGDGSDDAHATKAEGVAAGATSWNMVEGSGDGVPEIVMHG